MVYAMQRRSKASSQMTRTLAVVFLCLSLSTLTPAQHTKIEWDHDTDFAGLRTYAWQPSPSPAKGVWNQRIVDDIDKQLQAKGLAKVDSNPDVWVVYTRTIRKDQSDVGGGYVIGPSWGGSESGVPAIPETFEEGTLVVQIAAAKTKQVVWRGSASRTLSDNNKKNLKNLDQAIAKLLEDYPPKDKK
jgi:hypothetical protein